MLRRSFVAVAATVAVLAAGATVAQAQKMTYYCSAQIEWCSLMAEAFEKETGIKVAMTRKSSGETFAQIKAESRNPKGDIWWGGTGDPHLQAAEEGLTQAYESPMMSQLHGWALSQAKSANGKTVGIYAGALGIGYNSEILEKNNLPVPKCWKDLTDPVYKGHVQMANPNSSGTAYTALATVVQLFGEEGGFDFMKGLHKNISTYTKSGSAPIKAAARGENTIAVAFLHDVVALASRGFPVVAVGPCEGTGYEVGSMSIIKGARNLESAKKFYDFALGKAIQERAKEVQAFQVMSNKAAIPPKEAPKLEDIKLIDYDFKKYGSSAERRRLLAKWDNEVKSLPQ